MRLNREFEKLMVRLFRENKILGGLYSSFGQESDRQNGVAKMSWKQKKAPSVGRPCRF